MGWALAIAIPVLALTTELLPVAFGTGEKAVWDWAFLYVAMKFIVLPIGGTVAALVALVISRRSGRRVLRGLVPLMVVIAYDLLLVAHPSFWFAT